MPTAIRIVAGEIAVEAELDDSETARAIAAALPLEADGNRWGEEIYFAIPVVRGEEGATSDVEVGDLGYWPPGKALAIFFGPTPMSDGPKPVPASDVNPVGRITGDPTVLTAVPDGAGVRVEAVETP